MVDIMTKNACLGSARLWGFETKPGGLRINRTGTQDESM